MRRRKKARVCKEYLKPRIKYCKAVLATSQATLNSWSYTDGTVFYIDRNENDMEHSLQAAMGSHVWRMSDCSDALWNVNIGPSAYRKAQGHLVRVWGVLSEGRLHIAILDEGEVMNQEVYSDMIDTKFERWLGSSTLLVSDFERCIRSTSSVAALERIGVSLVEDYPRVSQDFNAIENAWLILRLSRLIGSLCDCCRQLSIRPHVWRRVVQDANPLRIHMP